MNPEDEVVKLLREHDAVLTAEANTTYGPCPMARFSPQQRVPVTGGQV